MRLVHLFVDFDGTITDDDGRPRDCICGSPIARFLAQPFIVSTMNVPGARNFFDRRPHLPKPKLILCPPLRYLPDQDTLGKDFDALGIKHAIIVDDLPKCVYAPNCRIVSPWDLL